MIRTICFGIILIFQTTGLDQLLGKQFNVEWNTRIPTAGNSWIMNNGNFVSSDMVQEDGINNWNNKSDIVRTFFYCNKTGRIHLGLNAKVKSSSSKIRITFEDQSKEITLNNNTFEDFYIGDLEITKPGYQYLDIEGMDLNETNAIDINAILFGNIKDKDLVYIKDDYYFGRRGPSVHLNYELPDGVEHIKWFYNEVMIPKGQDVVGSFFMANGFGEGYFGIQANSPSEKRILFSVWSPYQTDNPNAIPNDYKIKLLKKGDGVITGEFGNEGSGGQSYKIFNWKTDVNYGFLLGAKPNTDNSTDYTAYFYDPLERKWNLIAQFNRPKTNTYLKRLHSFLENFIPDQGVFDRKGLYTNQWVFNESGWHEISKARFTADNTARKGNRLDYSGGAENNNFFLKNCGFTKDRTLIDSYFVRDLLGIAPNIDFNTLN